MLVAVHPSDRPPLAVAYIWDCLQPKVVEFDQAITYVNRIKVS